MIGNKIEYIQAYTQVKCLLQYFPKEYKAKIPNKILEIFEKESDDKYNITIEPEKEIENQAIIPKTMDILVVLKYNYWSSEKEKAYLREKFYENEKQFQKELEQKYNTNHLFTKVKENRYVPENMAMVEYKESLLIKILNKIKKWFQ